MIHFTTPVAVLCLKFSLFKARTPKMQTAKMSSTQVLAGRVSARAPVSRRSTVVVKAGAYDAEVRRLGVLGWPAGCLPWRAAVGSPPVC